MQAYLGAWCSWVSCTQPVTAYWDMMFSKQCNALQIPAHHSLLHLTRHTQTLWLMWTENKYSAHWCRTSMQAQLGDPAHQALLHLTRDTDLYTGVSGICAPVQNSEYTLNTQAFTNFASQEMVILPTSLLAPWLNPASISISASRLAPVYDRLLESPSQPKWQITTPLTWNPKTSDSTKIDRQIIAQTPSQTSHKHPNSTLAKMTANPQTPKRLHRDNPKRVCALWEGELYIQ